MKLAVPVWEDRVSPVLDSADVLIVCEVLNGESRNRKEVYIGLGSLREKAGVIASHADVLVCGGISQLMQSYLEALDVTVHPWFMGDPVALMEIVARGDSPGHDYYMPGTAYLHDGTWRTGGD